MRTEKCIPLHVNVHSKVLAGRIADNTNGGVSARYHSLILVPEGAEAPENPTEPVLKVVRRNFGGTDYLHAEPVNAPGKNMIGWMFGGNFVYSSDSRYREWVCEYPIAIHDRCETQEQYDWLSR